MRHHHDDDEWEADARAVAKLCAHVLLFLLGCAIVGIYLTSCSAPKSSSVRWQKLSSGKETLEVTYDPGNHIRIGNLIFPVGAAP